MGQVAKLHETWEPFQGAGTLEAVEDGALVVRTARGAFRAARAFSCLVEPVPGDEVLVASTAPGTWYVLAVLRREAGAPARLVAEGDLELHAPNGRVCVTARDAVDVACAAEARVTAGAVRVSAVEGQVLVSQLSVLGARVQVEFERIKVLASTCDSAFDRFLQRVKRSYRRVEERDEVRAEQLDYAASKNLSLRGHNTLVTARELVKLDGEQVHLG